MHPLVSILIPAYNSGAWIAGTIRSALQQTWYKKEVIVVDDGSTDDTRSIAHRFASRNVQVITQLNQGAAAARNSAFSLAQGDYIQWLDADDLLAPDKIERQVQSLREHSPRTLLSGAWAYFMYRPSQARFTPTPLWQYLTPVEWLRRKMNDNLHMQTDNWLVSRELSEAAGPWDVRLWRDNDGEYFCRVIKASDGIAFVPEAKSYYRKAGFASVSYIGGSQKKLESLFLSMTLHMEYLRALEDSPRTRAACVNYIRTWLYEFYPHRPDLAAALKSIASELGGDVSDPRLPWKYNWLVRPFGWRVARAAQRFGPRARTAAVGTWEKAMYRLEGGNRL